jgi:hypothetical protein
MGVLGSLDALGDLGQAQTRGSEDAQGLVLILVDAWHAAGVYTI